MPTNELEKNVDAMENLDPTIVNGFWGFDTVKGMAESTLHKRKGSGKE